MKAHLRTSLLALPLVLSTAHAEDKVPRLAGAVPWRGDLSGLNMLDSRTIGAGPHYTAEFDDQGLVFTPGLGPEAPRHSLSFRLESIRRGAAVVQSAQATPPSVQHQTVVFPRGSSIDERYEVLADGVHQSFLFGEPLPGDGNLIVRGRIETTLGPGLPQPDGSLAFRDGGFGGVSFGAVTGIDAAGRTSPGTLRQDGDLLELSLPESFVEGAAYPLLLDPLVGTLISLSLTTDVSEPDVAYDVTNDEYLAVWSYQPAAASYELRGALIDAVSGAATLLTIGTGSTVSYQPSVGNVNVSNRFLLAYRSDVLGTQEVRVRAVDAGSGTVSSFQVAGSGAVDHRNPDVGGRRHNGGTEALIVWKELLYGLRGAEVTVNAAGAPVIGTIFTLTSDPNDQHPAVSHSEGESTDTYMVAWERGSQIYGLACDSAGAISAPEQMITLATTTNTKQSPDVDGNGTDFLVAYERSEDLAPALFDVWAVPVSVSGGALAVGDFVEVEADVGDDEREPTLAYAGAKTMIGYSDIDIDWNVYVKGLESATGTVCESEATTGTAADDVEPAIGAQYAGGPAAGDGLFLAWKGDEIEGTLLEAFGGGTITSLGGGCVGGGLMTATGVAAVGNPDFDLDLAGATGTTAVLSISLPTLPFLCGGCASILPAAFFSTVTPVVAGAASLNVPIPAQQSLDGVVVEAQWTVLFTGTSPCIFFPDIAASNQLEILLKF